MIGQVGAALLAIARRVPRPNGYQLARFAGAGRVRAMLYAVESMCREPAPAPVESAAMRELRVREALGEFNVEEKARSRL